MAVRRERGHTFPKSLDVMGVEIAVSYQGLNPWPLSSESVES